MTSLESQAVVASLLFRVRERLCSVPLEHVVETMRPLPVEALARTPAFICGVSVVRGVVVPVVDVGMILGSDGPPNPTRFVMIRTNDGQVALSVESVLGVRELTLASFQQLSPLLGEAATDVVSAIATLDSSLLFALQTARMVPDSVWEAIEIQGATK